MACVFHWEKSTCLAMVNCNRADFMEISKFPEILGELSMHKQCVPGSFFSTMHESLHGNVRHIPYPLFLETKGRVYGRARICFQKRPTLCFSKQRVGYMVGQGFVSRNASRNVCGRVQGEVQLLPLISCWIEATYYYTLCITSKDLATRHLAV